MSPDTPPSQGADHRGVSDEEMFRLSVPISSAQTIASCFVAFCHDLFNCILLLRFIISGMIVAISIGHEGARAARNEEDHRGGKASRWPPQAFSLHFLLSVLRRSVVRHLVGRAFCCLAGVDSGAKLYSQGIQIEGFFEAFFSHQLRLCSASQK